MNTILPNDLSQFVQHEMATGEYRSVDEVLCDGLRALREKRQQSAELRALLQPSIDRLDRGEGIIVEFDQLRAFFDEIVAEVKAELAAAAKSA